MCRVSALHSSRDDGRVAHHERMGETILDRGTWMPTVESRDGALQLTVIGGSDALHDPRSFSVPIRVEHVEVMRDSLSRHLQLYSVLLPICYAAGTRNPWDETAAAALLDRILFGSRDEVDALFARTRWNRRILLAHGADTGLVDQGRGRRVSCCGS